MSVIDHIKPLKKHSLGIPRMIMESLRHLGDVKPCNEKLRSIALEMYEKLLKHIEEALSGHCPAEREDNAAEIAAHLIIDAAFIHQCIAQTDYPIGEFPYNSVAAKLFPEEKQDADATGL